jgi:hypothetical protein
MAVLPELMEIPLVDAYQCSRCGVLVEAPKWGYLDGSIRPVRVQGHPLNHLLWLEQTAAKHEECQLRGAIV